VTNQPTPYPLIATYWYGTGSYRKIDGSSIAPSGFQINVARMKVAGKFEHNNYIKGTTTQVDLFSYAMMEMDDYSFRLLFIRRRQGSNHFGS